MTLRTDTIAGTILAGRPDARRPAFLEPNGDMRSYGDVERAIIDLAMELQDLGVAPNDVVGFVATRSPLGLIGFLAISAVAVCCPIGPRQRAEEVEAALVAMGVSTLIDGCGDDVARACARDMGLRVASCSHVNDGIELDVAVPDCAAEVEDIGVDPSIALILRTSGTTSMPKLVGLSHANVLAAAAAIRNAYRLGEQDLCFNMMPLYHVHGLISGGTSSLLSGSCQLCTGPLRPAQFAKAYATYRPTWFTGSPPVHLALRDHYESTGTRPENDRLRFLRSSSAPFPAPAVARLEKLFGAPLLENYGMTETASTVCSNLAPPARRKAGGVGSSISAEIRIVDDVHKDVPKGSEGQILVRGPSVITRYLGPEEISRDNFHDGWLKTGDIGRFDEDGHLFVIGRTKELIKRGGESIYPSEVDNALCARDDIAEAITFSISHPTLGEDLIAAVVAKVGTSPTESELRRHLAQEISTYKVPSAILIVGAIPKNETGKVVRRDMRTAFDSAFAAVGIPANGDVEAILLAAWRKVLRRDDIGVTDNVFVFGADPLRSVAVAETLREVLGTDVTPKQMFQNPTIREQAALLATRP